MCAVVMRALFSDPGMVVQEAIKVLPQKKSPRSYPSFSAVARSINVSSKSPIRVSAKASQDQATTS